MECPCVQFTGQCTCCRCRWGLESEVWRGCGMCLCRWSLGGCPGWPLQCPALLHTWAPPGATTRGLPRWWEDLEVGTLGLGGREEEEELRNSQSPSQVSDKALRSALWISYWLMPRCPVGRGRLCGIGQNFSGQESPQVSFLDQMGP